MGILKNFGVNPILLVAQIVNFLVIFFILKKFLYKPVLTVLKKRQDTIKEGLRQAEEASVRLEKVVEEEKKIIKFAQTQAKSILESAKEEASQTSKKMIEDSKKQIEKMIKDAQDLIARDRVIAEKSLGLKVSELAVRFLQRSLEGFFSEKEQKEVMEQALKEIKKSN